MGSQKGDIEEYRQESNEGIKFIRFSVPTCV